MHSSPPPRVISAPRRRYKNSKAETREPFAEQQPPCNDPLLWSGLRDGTAAAIADTADPKQAPLPLYKARAVAWVAVGYMYGDILFFFDAILVLYAWRDYYNQRARDYKAGRVTTLQHGGPAHEAHDPTSKPPAAGEAPPLPPHAQLALELPAKDGWLEAANPLAAAARAAEAVSAAGAVSTSSMTATMRTPAPTPLGVAAAGLGADAPGLHADRAQRAERISQLRAGAPSDTDALTPLAPPPGLRVGAVPGATQQALNPMNASAGRLEIEVTRASPGFGGAAEADLSQRRTGITGVVTRLVNAGASKVKLLRPSS